MIGDRLVVGLRDSKLSEKLQLDPKLTLDSAVMSARQSELVHRQKIDLRKDDDRKLQIDSVDIKWKHPSGHKRGDASTQGKSGPPKRHLNRVSVLVGKAQAMT